MRMNSSGPEREAVIVEGEQRSIWGSITFFMVVACGFSWAIWLPVIASQQGWIDTKISASPWGSFGPAVAAFVVMGVKGRLRELWRRFRFRGVAARYWLLALVVPVVAAALSVVPTFLLSDTPPEIVNLDKLYLAPLLFIVVLVIGGPLGEEPGWRGYLLPRLLQRYSPLVASLVIACLWTLWHLPLFWMEGAEQEGSSLALFFVAVVGSAIIFTWMFLVTNGNLVIAVALHTSINFGTFGLGLLIPSLSTDRISSLTQVVIITAFALAIVRAWLQRGKRYHP